MSGNSGNQPNGEGGTRGGGGCGGRMSWGERLGSSLPSRVNRNLLEGFFRDSRGPDGHGKVWRACPTVY